MTGPGATLLADRVVEVLFNSGDASSPRWSAGSGLLMHAAAVLTAAHVVGPTGELLVRFRGVDERRARIYPLPDGGRALDDDLDLAILEILDHPPDLPPLPVARLRADPTLDLPNLDGCTAFGHPAFARRQRPGRSAPVRESVRVDGYIPTGQGAVEGLATLRVRDAPQHPAVTGDVGRSPWQGISGAVVLAEGVAVGVVSEHHPPSGLNGLTVVPLAWIDRRPDAAVWWDLLGVLDPAELRSLPEPAAHATDQGLEHRYRELLLHCPEFARLPTLFDGLPPEFYLPRLLRVVTPARPDDDPVRDVADVTDAVTRLVIVAPAGMGKTELLHDLVRTLADKPGAVPVFLRLHDLARRGSGQDLVRFALAELFADLVDPAEIDLMAAALRRRRRENPTDVVFLFDGFDEVPLARQDEVLTRVRRVDRFVLTSRPTARIDVMPDGATYRIEGLTDDAIREYVHRWETRDTGVATLLDRLADDHQLAELARFPQLLQLLCWLWRPMSPEAGRSRGGIIGTAVDEAFARATRLGDLADGDDEIIPLRTRRVLRQAALDAVTTGEGDRMTLDRADLLGLMEQAGGPTLAGRLLAHARRTGLVVPTAAGDDLQFLHQTFRAHLAGEALVDADDPGRAIDELAMRRLGEDVLAAAVALQPAQMAAPVLARLEAAAEDLFRLNRRLAAVCMEGVPDLAPLDERLRPVVDAVLAGAREWWSRDRFTPAIGQLRTDYMTGRLHDALTDDDPYLRWAAAEGFRHLADPAIVPLLARRLPDEPWSAVQGALITALGRLGDPGAVPALWAYYENHDTDTSVLNLHALGEGLGRLAAEDHLASLLDHLDDGGAQAVLTGARPFVRPELQDAITRALGARIVLTDPSDVERYLAAAYNTDTDLDEEREAVDGLGTIGTGEAADALLQLLLTTTLDEIRERAAKALRDLEGEVTFHDVVDVLTRELRSDDQDDREYAALALLLLWTCGAEDTLVTMTVPAADPADPVGPADAGARVRAATALVRCLAGDVPDDLLREFATDPDPVVREAAVTALGRIARDDSADSSATTALLDQAAHTDPTGRVRRAALAALGRRQDSAATGTVTAALDADDADERAAAADALVVLADHATLPAVVRRLAVESAPLVRRALISAAVAAAPPGPLPGAVAEVVLTDLHGDDTAREFAAYTAGRASLVEAADTVRALMASDPVEDVRAAAAEAYGRLAPPDALLRVADEIAAAGPTDERMAVLTNALADRDATVVDLLTAHIAATGGNTIVAARAAVVRYPAYTYTVRSPGDDTDLDVLFDALGSPDSADRWSAVDELADRWQEPGALQRVVLAALDPHILVSERALKVISDLASDRDPDVLDADGVAALGEETTLRRFVAMLDCSDLQIRIGWLLQHVEFLPALLRAAAAGQYSVRQVLWELSDRYGLRLFADGRAVLPSGREVGWDDLPRVLAHGQAGPAW